MRLVPVTIVRVYITESSKLLKPILDYLHDAAKIRGVSVFRAVTGYGETGMHTASLVDLSLDLPLAVEFFDHPEKVIQALAHLHTVIKAEHIVCWSAQANEN